MTSGALAMLPSTEVAVIVAVPWEPPAVRRPVEGSWRCFEKKVRRGRMKEN